MVRPLARHFGLRNIPPESGLPARMGAFPLRASRYAAGLRISPHNAPPHAGVTAKSVAPRCSPMGTRGGIANDGAGTHPMPMNMISSCSAARDPGETRILNWQHMARQSPVQWGRMFEMQAGLQRTLPTGGIVQIRFRRESVSSEFRAGQPEWRRGDPGSGHQAHPRGPAVRS